jgi:hypothetical protein
MDASMMKELGDIVVEVAKNGGITAVQIFAVIYGAQIIQLVTSWTFVLIIAKGIYSLFIKALDKV